MEQSFENREGKIWFNGEMIEWKKANVHVLNHGLHYASSVFEGERAYNGKIFKSKEHTERLFNAAKTMDMKMPFTVEEILEAKNSTLKENGFSNAYVRPVVWRGSEMMAVSAQTTKINVAIAAWAWPSYFDPEQKMKGIKLDIAKWKRPDPKTAPVHVKAAGLYMICTLSKHDAEAKGYSDALMLDWRGQVAEATGANIFFKDKNGELHTPIPDSFLDGITRRTVIQIAKSKNIKVHERKIKPEELKDFDGCFLTGTAAEVTPVSTIAEYQFKVCDLIIDLNESYLALVKKKKAA